jgi:hypothetical protein
VAAGEQIEGCTLYGERPVAIEDDVWLVGSCIVASGVTLGKRLVALIASNITKSWPENTVLAGSPAMPKPNLSFYRPVTQLEKWEMLSVWLDEIAKANDMQVQKTQSWIVLSSSKWQGVERIGFAVDETAASDLAQEFPDSSICNLENKTYSKKLSNIEALVLKSLAGNKARFYQSA